MLVSSNYVDDGAVYYINGQEVSRVNMYEGFVPPVTITYQTTAMYSTSEGVFFTNVIPSTLLSEGDNVLAVEVHQITEGSSDVVFGLGLTELFLPPSAVVITNEPQDITAVDGGPASFSVGFAGPTFEIQWFKYQNGQDIPVEGATHRTLTFANVSTNEAGFYYAVIRNPINEVISRKALLSVMVGGEVIPVLRGPGLASALVQSNGILLTFTKPLLPSSASVDNFRLTNSAGETFAARAASLISPSNILLTLDPFPADKYGIVVNGVRDNSATQDEIAANTSATLGLHLVIPIDAVWSYNTNGMDLGSDWRETGFGDTTPDWPVGPALIADETPFSLPAPIKTPISRFVNEQYHFTFYFRYHFELPMALTNAPVAMWHVIDDGAIMYINGQQFHAFNMTNDASNVTYTSEAPATILDGVFQGPFTAILNNLVAGDNVIAVEVHQNGYFSSDVVFGAELTLHAPSVVSPGVWRPSLRISRDAEGIIIHFPEQGGILEYTTLLGVDASWSPVPNQTNHFRVNPDGATQRFYRLRQ